MLFRSLAFKELQEELNIKAEPKFSDFLNRDGILETVKSDKAELYKAKLFELLDKALASLLSAKQRDGEGTFKDLTELGNKFKTSLAIVNAKSAELEVYIKQTLKERIQTLESELNLDQNRFVQEVGLLLVKYSINEEQKRLETHLKIGRAHV